MFTNKYKSFLRFSLIETLPPDSVQFIILAGVGQGLEDPVIRR